MLRIFQILSPALLLTLATVQLPAQVPASASKLTPAEIKRAEKYARLRADYAASDRYNPQVPSQHDIDNIRRRLAQNQNDEALKLTDTLIAKNPVSAELHAYRAVALGALGKTAEADAATDAQKGIQDAIMMTGNGASPDTAFQILTPTDIQSVADKLRVKILGQTRPTTRNTHVYYIVAVQNVIQRRGEQIQRNYYFNIDPIDAWQKAHSKPGSKTGAKGGAKIGAATVVGDESGDSGPRLISTTGGGKSKTWASFADLKKAADTGDSGALFELGTMYLNGSADTPQSTTQGLFYIERAAALGSGDANFRLGKLYADGSDGIPQDSPKAFNYYMAAARVGNPIAQHNVGAMIASGRGVTRDYAEGLAWLILASKKNSEAAEGEKKLRNFLRNHPETIAAAEARAVELKDELAGRVVPKRVMAVASAASDAAGNGGKSKTPKDYLDLKKAADDNVPDALLELGLMYLSGTNGAPRSIAQAQSCLERAASLGSSAANFQLGEFWAGGVTGLLPQDLPKAYGYYVAAARAGDPVAQHTVGTMLVSGRGVNRDYAEGLAWLILSAKKAPGAEANEQRLREFLAPHPETITAGEARAAELGRDIADKNAAAKN